MRLWLAGLVCCVAATVWGQQAPAPEPAPAAQDQPITTLRTGTSIVLVPALVTTKSGEPVFTLTADDFLLSDDGVMQKLRLEEETDQQPLALVVIIEAGGSGPDHLDNYTRLGTMVESLVGNVEHTVAVVGFDSEAAVVQPWTANMNTVDEAIRGIGPGDGKAAMLDALGFSVDLLAKQPPRYRRAILMLSETHDNGSHIDVQDAVKKVSDTNTIIYSVAFSSTKAEAKHEDSGFSSLEPGPDHGCFSRKLPDGAEPTRQPGVISQDYDCLAMLAPPLRAARIAVMAIIGSLRKNVPETVAHLTGGEYLSFSNEKTLEKDMQTLTNHVPNRYVLSFRPSDPRPGLHTVLLTLKDRPQLKVAARTSYWAEEPGGAAH